MLSRAKNGTILYQMSKTTAFEVCTQIQLYTGTGWIIGITDAFLDFLKLTQN